jgi:hypothetical protein
MKTNCEYKNARAGTPGAKDFKSGFAVPPERRLHPSPFSMLPIEGVVIKDSRHAGVRRCSIAWRFRAAVL